MIIIPEVYLKNQKAIPIDNAKGPFFDEDPIELAKKIKETGSDTICVTDINIPASGPSLNTALINRIKNELEIKAVVSGGFKSLSTISSYIAAGVELVILGSVAYQQPDLLKESNKKFPGKIAVSIDVKDGRVTIPGWSVAANKTAVDYARTFREAGIRFVVYSDQNQAGELDNKCVDRLEKLCKEAYLRVLIRSSINTTSDIEKIIERQIQRLDALILSRPIYRGTIDLKAANSMVISLQKEINTEPTMTEM